MRPAVGGVETREHAVAGEEEVLAARRRESGRAERSRLHERDRNESVAAERVELEPRRQQRAQHLGR